MGKFADKVKEIWEAVKTLPDQIDKLIDQGQEILETLFNLF